MFTSRSGQTPVRIGLALAAAAVWHLPAVASVLTTTTVLPSCTGGSNCADTGYVSTTAAGATTGFIGGSVGGYNPSNYNFTSAFNTWNNANSDLWTLKDGGLLNVQLTVNAALTSGTSYGGLNDITVTLSNFVQGGGPSETQLVWTQGLFINYTPTGGVGSGALNTLDTYSLSAGSPGSGGAFTTACEALPGQSPGPNNTSPSIVPAVNLNQAYCDPIYPFQYASTQQYNANYGTPLGTDPFFDAPGTSYNGGAFRGESLLSTITFGTNASGSITSRTLTVYQGVSYGFNLTTNAPGPSGSTTLASNLLLQTVPEPATALLLGIALPALAISRRRSA